jgi:DNA-binding winged helix-turn-helix (wHTH) protein
MTDPRPARRYRFGAFEADAASGELLAREEISRELWPDGTFVDYEHGVNAAVNRIREALGDKASSPRFVETLARRGYRFVAPVERIGSGENPAPPVPEPPSPPASEQTAKEQAPAPAAPDAKLLSRILASPEELPKASHRVVLTLFVLLQLMYVGFYVGALANLAEIEDLFSLLPKATYVLNLLIVTAAMLIPVRAFVLSAVLFRAPGADAKFLKLWPFLLVLDELWSLSPFLLLHHIDFGVALACTTLLVYSPFAQRSLVLMGAGGSDRESAATAG